MNRSFIIDCRFVKSIQTADPFQGISERGCGVAIQVDLCRHSEVSGKAQGQCSHCPSSWQPSLDALWTALSTLALVP